MGLNFYSFSFFALFFAFQFSPFVLTLPFCAAIAWAMALRSCLATDFAPVLATPAQREQVFRSQGMTIQASSLEKIFRLTVLFISHQAEVIRIYAALCSAFVMQLKPIGIRTTKKLPDNLVRDYLMSVWPRIWAQHPVTFVIHGSYPEPAAGIRLDANLFSQALWESAKLNLKHSALIVAEMPRWGNFFPPKPEGSE